jgi:hypothetical protein
MAVDNVAVICDGDRGCLPLCSIGVAISHIRHMYTGDHTAIRGVCKDRFSTNYSVYSVLQMIIVLHHSKIAKPTGISGSTDHPDFERKLGISVFSPASLGDQVRLAVIERCLG